jgi:alkylation response protein AidB-like acyl-CoA dehydrogenase
VNPDLTETQILLRDTVRQYAEAEIPFARIRELEGSGDGDEALWRALVEQGWLGTPFPDDLGGGDAGLVEAGLIVDELARRAAIVPVVEVFASSIALLRHSSERGRQIARDVIAGRCIPVPAVLEQGDRYENIVAEVVGGRLTGEKFFVDYAEFATHHLVAAAQDGENGLFLVATGDPAVKCEAVPTMGRTPQSRVRYDAAVAERVGDAEALRLLTNIARALTTVQIVACMQQSLDQTVAYTNAREQFGRPLSTFQAVQHHGANMAMHLESNRFLAYEVLDALERGDATDEQVAIAKASASRSVPEVTMLGHQLHGGQGFIEENDLYFFTIRGKDRSLAWGTAEECLEIIAERVDEPARWL